MISLLLTFFILIYTQVFIKKANNSDNTPVEDQQRIETVSIESYFAPNNNLINLNLLSKVLNYKLAVLATINYVEIVFSNKQINVFIDLEQICESNNEINKKFFLESIAVFFNNDVSIAIHVQDNIIDFERAKKLRSMLKEYSKNIKIILNTALQGNTKLQGNSIGLISLESN